MSKYIHSLALILVFAATVVHTQVVPRGHVTDATHV